MHGRIFFKELMKFKLMSVLKKYLANSTDSKQTKKMCLLLCHAAQTSIRHLQFTDGHKTSG